ncbi:MAG: nitrate- and nitrite sensing domain-containing protein [Campylobacterota bacterium]|nr:nitrate- and nitrite sensing domain-containing protein [Campylobacterota bacterium]
MRTILLLFMLVIMNASAFSLFDKTDEEQIAKIAYIDSLKDLIVATQKTRGLTNNFMNGNVVAQLLVYHERSEMKKALRALKRQKMSVDTTTQQKIVELKKALKQLNKKAFKQPSGQTFQNYTEMINEMLALGSNIAQNSFSKNEKFTQQATALMMSVVLPLTEQIGKTRGLGSGIVARGHSLDIEVPKMTGFVNEAERLSGKLAADTKSIYASNSKKYPSDLVNKVEMINADIRAYVALTREKVIGQKEIKLDPNIYFDQGTAAISKVLTVFTINKTALTQ